VTYTFDVDGYLATRGADTFQYSARGELLSATVGGQTVTYAYDGMGRRVSRTEGASTVQYLYGNPSNPLQITASREPSGALTVYYYGAANQLFALERSGSRYYVATDQVGSPRVVSDATGAVVKALRYDSFGKVLSDSDPSFVLALGYAGGIADNKTGLVRFGFRDYDAAAGRWTARDPSLYLGGTNLYEYAGNNPILGTDAAGLAVTLGFSAYEGLGGGVSITFDWTGFKVCGEVGVGVGGGFEGGWESEVGDVNTNVSLLADASAKLGPVKIGGGAEVNLGTGCAKGKGTLGPVQFTAIKGNDITGVKGKIGIDGLDQKLGAGIGAKLAVKACGGYKG
jgi:RHS repeat-associated protein